jgi:protein-disulfide isomerase
VSRPAHARDPWIYGRADARFTIIEYADLECPYCREYFPVLREWITAHPDVNWQWHHLPLAIHEPTATRTARIAECVGETGGSAAFWNAVAWIYQSPRADEENMPRDVQLPATSSAFQSCMRSERPDVRIRAQAESAAREQITATPTLRLVDRDTGKSLTLRGLMEGDALLSAIDLLLAPSSDAAHALE